MLDKIEITLASGMTLHALPRAYFKESDYPYIWFEPIYGSTRIHLFHKRHFPFIDKHELAKSVCGKTFHGIDLYAGSTLNLAPCSNCSRIQQREVSRLLRTEKNRYFQLDKN